MRLTDDGLPLRGRWLRYFMLGCIVLLVIAEIALLFPVMIVVTHHPPPGWQPTPVPAARP